MRAADLLARVDPAGNVIGLGPPGPCVMTGSHIDTVGPVRLSASLQRLIGAVCRERGFRTLRMPSGAGHDAQLLAAVTDAGMMFVPSRGGRSHRPDESTAWPAIGRGVAVLLDTLRRLLSR